MRNRLCSAAAEVTKYLAEVQGKYGPGPGFTLRTTAQPIFREGKEDLRATEELRGHCESKFTSESEPCGDRACSKPLTTLRISFWTSKSVVILDRVHHAAPRLGKKQHGERMAGLCSEVLCLLHTKPTGMEEYLWIRYSYMFQRGLANNNLQHHSHFNSAPPLRKHWHRKAFS